jgi:hypothetical protein
VSWLVDNASESDINLSAVEFEPWPAANGSLDEIRWGDNMLGVGPFDDTDEIVLDPEIPPVLSVGASTYFSMRFNFEAGSHGYQLGLGFDAGCTLQGSW